MQQQLGEAHKTLQTVSNSFKSKNPNFDRAWRQMIKKDGISLVNELKSTFTISYLLKGFHFRLIVDTNYIFGQIKGSIKKSRPIEDSFLFKLLQSKSIYIYAPPKLKEELADKIESVLKEEERVLARQYASMLISRITIQDAPWMDEWKRANQLIGEKDEDDVPFLALALAVDGHAILSNDGIFQKQGDCKVWKFHDTDQIVTSFHSGVLSFAIVGATTELFTFLLSTIYKVIRDLLTELLDLLTNLLQGVTQVISKLPPELAVPIGICLLIYCSVNDNGKAFVKGVSRAIQGVLLRIKDFVNSMIKNLKLLQDQAATYALPTMEFLGYLLAEYTTLEQEISSLEGKV